MEGVVNAIILKSVGL